MSALIIEVEKFVFSFLSKNIHSNFVYHNLAHTQRVVESVKEIAESLKLDNIALENLVIAAWFHDIGYVEGSDNHEQKSIKIAAKFLKENNFDEKRIQVVSEVILATEMNSVPKNILEEIIRDADCAHLASKDFIDYTSLLRREWELSLEKKYTNAEWINLNLAFLTQKHRYYTDFALRNWSEGKEKNIAKLLKNKKKVKNLSRKKLL